MVEALREKLEGLGFESHWSYWEALLSSASACIKIPQHPQPNHTVTPTHIEPEKYNTRDKPTVSRKLLKMDVLTFETCRAVNGEIIKKVTSSWSIFIQLLSSPYYNSYKCL